jgi:hypothetical protein
VLSLIKGQNIVQKISDETLLEDVMKSPSVTLEERAMLFSVNHQSVYAMLNDLWTIRKKLFSMKKETRRKINIFYIDESGIKNTLRSEYAWSPRGKSVNDERKGNSTEKLNIIAPMIYECSTDAEIISGSDIPLCFWNSKKFSCCDGQRKFS